MNQSVIYALDFDGVICDSAIETAVSGWKAGQQLWTDYPEDLPSESLLNSFRQVRPVMKTGYEAILIMRLLFKGCEVTQLVADYLPLTQQLITNEGLTVEILKKQFAAVRDHWIATNPSEWLAMNPLFKGVAEKLLQLQQDNWFIITTKQERFVQQILQANQIHLAPEHIYGLDRGRSKLEILADLMRQFPQHHFYFVEDMLPTLLEIQDQLGSESITLQLADWGYNTLMQRQQALENGMVCLRIDEFLCLH